MITSSILLIFIGSYFLYNTSKKAILNNELTFGKWIQSNPKTSKAIAIILYITALTTNIITLGRTSGMLFWLLLVMVSLSLVIVISPVKKISYKHILTLFLVLFVLEFIF